VDFAAFEAAYTEARGIEALSRHDARDFFERHFAPALIVLADGSSEFTTPGPSQR
jgi:membrane-bound lytic murein transglycosylase A